MKSKLVTSTLILGLIACEAWSSRERESLVVSRGGIPRTLIQENKELMGETEALESELAELISALSGESGDAGNEDEGGTGANPDSPRTTDAVTLFQATEDTRNRIRQIRNCTAAARQLVGVPYAPIDDYTVQVPTGMHWSIGTATMLAVAQAEVYHHTYNHLPSSALRAMAAAIVHFRWLSALFPADGTAVNILSTRTLYYREHAVPNTLTLRCGHPDVHSPESAPTWCYLKQTPSPPATSHCIMHHISEPKLTLYDDEADELLERAISSLLGPVTVERVPVRLRVSYCGDILTPPPGYQRQGLPLKIPMYGYGLPEIDTVDYAEWYNAPLTVSQIHIAVHLKIPGEEPQLNYE
ncbi:MAG: hypothetical protein LBJ69_03180 [Holosporales bacterium]|jgi:hypothetical protein|nr:hypothetical protein [Holosporales bacterium]